jgi:hypothetical protein
VWYRLPQCRYFDCCYDKERYTTLIKWRKFDFGGRVLSKIDVLSLLPARQDVLRDHRAAAIKKPDSAVF